MVTCKYFQQGNCRYGQHCRNEHIYGNKYNYQAPRVAPQPQTKPLAEVTVEQLLNQVKLDTVAAIRGNQWLLTAYAPYKEKANMPGFTDQSFEEIRLLVYEAQNNNTLPQTINIINQRIEDAKRKFQNLLEPNALMIRTVQSIYNGETPNDPFQAVDINNKPSAFAAAVASLVSPPQSNQANSIFSNQNASPQSIFATANTQQPSSLFGNANKQFENGGFPTSQQPSDIFKNQAQSVFGNQNVFAVQNSQPGLAQTTPDPASLFSNASKSIFSKEIPQNPSNVFAQSNPQATIVNDTSPFANSPFSLPGRVQSSGFPSSIPSVAQIDAYSPEEAISQEDLAEFLSNSFRLGYIPEIAPPKSVC